MTNSLQRRTKIVCTIGPSCQDPKVLASMAENGMAIARINVSHGTRENHLALIESLQALSAKSTFPVAIMIDTRGAEIRTGDVLDPIKITKGQEVIFTSDADHTEHSGRTVIRVNYDGFSNDVRETDRILLDNGELSFDILQFEANGVVSARAREDGKIGTRRHVNLPGADIDLPSITEKDWDDIALAAERNIEFVALSFIRNAEEVESVREFLRAKNPNVRIISKIETRKGVKNIAEIIDASDGIMVARGDLGADVPFEELPAIQDEIVYRCRDAGKPVIIATHMLESMIEHPMPTRAEVTDTAYAVLTGADATMLSGETAGGKHPLTALDAMVRIQTATEVHMARLKSSFETKLIDALEERAQAVLMQAEKEGVAAVLIETQNGEGPRIMSKFRSLLPVLAVTGEPMLQSQLIFHFGVFPLRAKVGDASSALLEAVKKKLLQKGDHVLITDDSFENVSIETV